MNHSFNQIKWGIVGLGKIAHRFADDFQYVKNGTVVAVASRTAEKSGAFAGKFCVPKHYSSYEALYADPDVDIVYVATPHSLHRECVMKALGAGKAVLCEKPLGISSDEVVEMRRMAEKENRFLMEAMWTAFFPATRHFKKLLEENEAGEVGHISISAGYKSKEKDPASRLLAKELAGGAMLDMGVYPLSLLVNHFDDVRVVNKRRILGPTGVDLQTHITCRVNDRITADLSCAINKEMKNEVEISGCKGRIVLESPWWHSTAVTLRRYKGRCSRMEFQKAGLGLHYEIEHVHSLIGKGALESPIWPLAISEKVAACIEQL